MARNNASRNSGRSVRRVGGGGRVSPRGMRRGEQLAMAGPVTVYKLGDVVRVDPATDLDPQRYATHMQRVMVLERDGLRCRYCGCEVTLNSANIDHVVPWLRGGRTELDNLVSCCQRCNERKGNKTRRPRRIGYSDRKKRSKRS